MKGIGNITLLLLLAILSLCSNKSSEQIENDTISGDINIHEDGEKIPWNGITSDAFLEVQNQLLLRTQKQRSTLEMCIL